MQQFGAEIFVADLIGLAMLRELGPLMTAILLAGRSGAAFAAEIGTMKVNEEIDALTTMGLDPVRFLVTPRVIAALLDDAAADPVRRPGRPARRRADAAVVLDSVRHLRARGGGHRRLQRLHGRLRQVVRVRDPDRRYRLPARPADRRPARRPSANPATRAVVSGIILLVVVDGIFAVVYFFLDI